MSIDKLRSMFTVQVAGSDEQQGTSCRTNKIFRSLSFSGALSFVKSGLAIQREGWNGSGLRVKAQFPDEHSKMTLPYLYLEYPADHKTLPGARVPWVASQTDIMAEDWRVVE